jgi:hypothetical protein
MAYVNYKTCIFLATEVTKFLHYQILHEWPEKPQNKQGQIQPVSHIIRTRYLYNAKQERLCTIKQRYEILVNSSLLVRLISSKKNIQPVARGQHVARGDICNEPACLNYFSSQTVIERQSNSTRFG